MGQFRYFPDASGISATKYRLQDRPRFMQSATGWRTACTAGRAMAHNSFPSLL
ncbi:hypothetical protein [Sphingobacterium hotanense]|uniref:hypothetical protein n=1 Tax=Sphingobacterium hotanense TaxID=649196 RepID=UPI0021A94250|nr:hypothetical protein [Sphingobacterium hotanense]MCT1526217.1 hypothetical protein [Sphingobacterium hotanense]